MKIEIHHYHHYDVPNIEIRSSCDLAINNGNGDISYHDWNVKNSKGCHQCDGRRKKGYYIDQNNLTHKTKK